MISLRPRPWSDHQRQILIVLLVIVSAYLSIRIYRNPIYVADPQPLDPPRAAEVEDRIDPNTADAHILAALPLIGEKRAQDIVTYREQYVALHGGQPAFTVPADLLKIRGIGNAMLTQIEPFLIFPNTSPATTQADH